MNNQPYTLWQLIDKLLEKPASTLDAVKEVLPIEFIERLGTSFFTPWDGKGFRLIDEVEIKTVNLRIRHEDGISRILVPELVPSTACVTHEQVSAKFPYAIFNIGHSPHEANYYSITTHGGKLLFSFAMHHPDCLSFVVINR